MRIRMLAALVVLCAGAAFAATMSVQVRNGKVRNRPSQLGRIVESVPYGEFVEAGNLRRGWYPVTLANGKKGYLHQSALSTKAIKMSAGTTDVATGVSDDEVSLAAKGFNEQVEAELKAKTFIGNIDRVGEMTKVTPGSRRIVEVLLDDKPGPVYLQAWGGTNTIARALKTIQDRHPGQMRKVFPQGDHLHHPGPGQRGHPRPVRWRSR